MIKSICDNCASKACIWRAESDTLDPPTTDCPLFVKKSITNADKIRSMTDEELAEYLHSLEWGRFPLTKLKWLDWLKQEVTENVL